MSGSPFDQARIRDDVVRYEYAERLFDMLRHLHQEIAGGDAELSANLKAGRLDGLQIAMNILDEEMGRLRAAWG